MSMYSYVVIPRKKIYVYAGSGVRKEEFEDAVRRYTKFMDLLNRDYETYIDISESSAKDITVDQIRAILDLLNAVIEVYDNVIPWTALSIVYNLEEDEKWEFVDECELSKYIDETYAEV